MQTNGKFAKGWGVRSPDFVPKGSFVCEYIGEYISDDVLRSNPCLHPDPSSALPPVLPVPLSPRPARL